MQYALLTGMFVFYDECQSKDVRARVKRGETPYVDPRWRTRSSGENALVEIMEQCWARNPQDRPSIGDLVLQLREAVSQEKLRQFGYGKMWRQRGESGNNA